MRGCWKIVMIGWLTGCNWFYGLDDTTVRDGGMSSSDGPPPDALPSNCRVMLPSAVEQDTYLLDNSQHGVRSGNGVGYDVDLVDAAHPGLFKFPIGGIAPGEVISAAVLTIVVVDHADECASGCGLCPTIDATSYQIYWNRDDWTDDAATSTKRMTNASWQQPFAAGASDRSALVVERELPRGFGPKELVIPMTAALATPPPPAWVGSGFVTLQLRTNGTAPLAIAADDRDESSCADGASKATAIFTVCTP